MIRPKRSSSTIPAVLALALPALLALASCAGPVKRPCSEGGQPAYADGKPRKGTKQCEQVKDASGRFVNHGHYTEWYPSGKRSIEGEYSGGMKSGKWTEWDELGRKLSEKWFEAGEEVEGREAQPYNGLAPQPRRKVAAKESNDSVASSAAAPAPGPSGKPAAPGKAAPASAVAPDAVAVPPVTPRN